MGRKIIVASFCVAGVAAILLAWKFWPSEGTRRRDDGRPTSAASPMPIPLPVGKKLTVEQAVVWNKKREWDRGDYYIAGYFKSQGRWGAFRGVTPISTWDESYDNAHCFPRVGDYGANYWEGEMTQARIFANSTRDGLKSREQEIKRNEQIVAFDGKIGGTQAAFPESEHVQIALPRGAVEAARRSLQEVARDKDRLQAWEVLAERAAVESLKKHTGLALVESVARFCAENPDIEAVAILDLYSQERPSLVKCFAREGKVVRERPKPTTRDLEAALAEFIYGLQSTIR